MNPLDAIPSPLAAGKPLLRPALDLTLYPEDLRRADVHALLDLFRSIAPAGAAWRWKLADFTMYKPFDPRAGGSLDSEAMDRFHRRLEQGWRSEFRLWDGEHSSESWSFHCYRVPRREGAEPQAFYRFLLPASLSPGTLARIAETVLGTVGFDSGHGGLVWVYDGALLDVAFDRIYSFARRYWGVDVEHLNSTLPLMRTGIKGVSWLTLLGRARFDALPDAPELAKLDGSDVRYSEGPEGAMLRIGSEPDILDQHRPPGRLDIYQNVARALEPLFLPDFPDLPGRFGDEGNSAAWFRRFLEPERWRQ